MQKEWSCRIALLLLVKGSIIKMIQLFVLEQKSLIKADESNASFFIIFRTITPNHHRYPHHCQNLKKSLHLHTAYNRCINLRLFILPQKVSIKKDVFKTGYPTSGNYGLPNQISSSDFQVLSHSTYLEMPCRNNTRRRSIFSIIEHPQWQSQTNITNQEPGWKSAALEY